MIKYPDYRTFTGMRSCHEGLRPKVNPPDIGYSASLLNYFFRETDGIKTRAWRNKRKKHKPGNHDIREHRRILRYPPPYRPQ